MQGKFVFCCFQYSLIPHFAQLFREGAAVEVEVIGQALTVEGDAETFAARLRGLIGEIQQQPSPDGLRGRAEDALREGQVLVQRDVCLLYTSDAADEP